MTGYDAIIIGTGIGGGTAGRALAEAGLNVLFIEQGPAGFRTEEQHISVTMTDAQARLMRGFWPDPVTVTLNGQIQTFYAPLGAAVGGSSAFYAATLERPARHDLDDHPDRPHPTGGWPVTFDELLPWLQRAEDLFQVTGTLDPLDPGPPLPPGAPPTPGDRAIMDRLTARGLHPYALHSALKRLPGCAECLGRKCPRPCKMDGRSAGVEPALVTGRATLWDRARVTRILSRQGRAIGVQVWRDGATHTVHAAHVVLAAGALSSPRLVAASGLAAPDGPAGRHLMFHLNEIFAYFPGHGSDDQPSKAVGFRDLYHHQGQRLGMVQAMGLNVGTVEILDQLRRRMAELPFGQTRLMREGLRLPAALGRRLLGPAKLFVGLLEDLPYPSNRVLPDPDQIRIHYDLRAELLARRALFRNAIRTAMGRTRVMFADHRPTPNWGHPCGTLRMGSDPATAVTDAWGRLRGCDGLWVADASVFPTAMGVNPSLTIAAHALRVAQAISTGAP